MDTSGTNLGGPKTASTRPDQYTKEELASILKFGAANIFNNAADQTKLEEMDLDDLLNKAEAYDTSVAPSGTSLGGEAFLNQFAVRDVKSDLTSWDDIIPADQRPEIDRSIKIELDSESRRSSNLPSGAYHGLDEATSQLADGRKKAAPRRSEAQRAVDMSDRDMRVLIRGLQRFGDIRHRYDAIVKDAKLESKNRTIILDTVDELIQTCRDAIVAKQDLIQSRKAAGDEVPTAMKNKAVLVNFKGISSINAETVVQRADQLKILHTCACSLVRVPD